MTRSADEFMRRFLLHVFPGGSHRTRHYGLLANAQRGDHLTRARELLNVVPDIDADHEDTNVPTFVCPDCDAAMVLIDVLVRGQPIRAPPEFRFAPQTPSVPTALPIIHSV